MHSPIGGGARAPRSDPCRRGHSFHPGKRAAPRRGLVRRALVLGTPLPPVSAGDRHRERRLARLDDARRSRRARARASWRRWAAVTTPAAHAGRGARARAVHRLRGRHGRRRGGQPRGRAPGLRALRAARSGSARRTVLTAPRGDILFFGGDTAYPVATAQEILNRVIVPWNQVLEATLPTTVTAASASCSASRATTTGTTASTASRACSGAARAGVGAARRR